MINPYMWPIFGIIKYSLYGPCCQKAYIFSSFFYIIRLIIPYILRINIFTVLLPSIFCSVIRFKKYHKIKPELMHTTLIMLLLWCMLLLTRLGAIHAHSWKIYLSVYLIYLSQIIIYQGLLPKMNSLSDSMNSINGLL